MNKIKACFFDIDWTLYDHEKKEWSKSAVSSLKEISRRGVKLILCTARPFHSMDKFGVFSLGIPFDGYIASAGAVVNMEGHFIRKTLMKKEDIVSFGKQCLFDGYDMEYVEVENRKLLAPSNEYSDRFYSVYKEAIPEVSPYEGEEVVGINFFAPKEADDKYRMLFPQLIYNRYFDYAVDVMGEPHEKGDGVEAALAYLGISRDEALGFGDDIQDISMAEHLPHFVCMGQGKEALKEKSEFVSSPVGEDGVYRGLAHYKLVK